MRNEKGAFFAGGNNKQAIEMLILALIYMLLPERTHQLEDGMAIWCKDAHE